MGRFEKIHRNAEVVKAVVSGKTYAEVALEHGVSRSRIEQICKAAGAKSLHHQPLTPNEKQDILAQAHALAGNGFSPADIRSTRARETVRSFLIAKGLYTPWIANDKWDDDQDAQIIARYYDIGPTGGARAIANDLGRTRNEVIGRANRLKKLGLLKAKEIY